MISSVNAVVRDFQRGLQLRVLDLRVVHPEKQRYKSLTRTRVEVDNTKLKAALKIADDSVDRDDHI
jgi:hypothetical protein